MTNRPAPTSENDAVGGGDGVEALICPSCGYDLRGAVRERCSECGAKIDPEQLRTSGFAWGHRRQRGRVRAYLSTVWLVTIGSRRIEHEASRKQDPSDARRFRLVTAVLVAVGLLSAFGAAVAAHEGLAFLAVQPGEFVGARTSELWLQDLAVPWCAGATLPPVVPLLLICFAFAITAAHRPLFRLADAPSWRRERAEAVANYAIAPMFLALPAGAWGALMVREYYEGSEPFAGWIFLWLLVGLAVPGSIVRIAQWSMRVRYAGMDRIVIDVPHLLARWLWNVLLFLFILPWCIGLVWIIIDGFL